jgi:hypothetical protein
MKTMWKDIKQLVTLKQSPTPLRSMIEVGDLKLTDAKLIANVFNNYFSNIRSNMANDIPTVTTIFQDYLNGSIYIFQSFELFPTTTFEIEEEISNLNNSFKICWSIQHRIKLLKMLKSILSAPLVHIFLIVYFYLVLFLTN